MQLGTPSLCSRSFASASVRAQTRVVRMPLSASSSSTRTRSAGSSSTSSSVCGSASQAECSSSAEPAETATTISSCPHPATGRLVDLIRDNTDCRAPRKPVQVRPGRQPGGSAVREDHEPHPGRPGACRQLEDAADEIGRRPGLPALPAAAAGKRPAGSRPARGRSAGVGRRRDPGGRPRGPRILAGARSGHSRRYSSRPSRRSRPSRLSRLASGSANHSPANRQAVNTVMSTETSP